MNKRETKNVLKRLAKENGWELSEKGFPDFLGFKENNFMCVYVKPYKHIPLRNEQIRVADILTNLGIKVYKFTSDSDGLVAWQKIEKEEKWARARITNMMIVNENKKLTKKKFESELKKHQFIDDGDIKS